MSLWEGSSAPKRLDSVLFLMADTQFLGFKGTCQTAECLQSTNDESSTVFFMSLLTVLLGPEVTEEK